MKQKIQPTILVNYIFLILASAFMPSNWMRTISHVWCNLKLIAGAVVVFSECLCCFNNIKRVDACYRTNSPKDQLHRRGEFREGTRSKKSGSLKEAGLMLWSIGESNS